MKVHELQVDIRAYWHAGGGRGAGAVLDAVVYRDADGLPVLPGRHLKGLLRDAVARAASWDWDGYAGLAERLFGRPAETRRASEPGCLRLSDARLPDGVVAWLRSNEGKAHRAALFRALDATAIDADTGTADGHSLRGIEVTVPLTLYARIEPVPGREAPEDWPARIAEVLPLIDAVGGWRTRGLGRAVLTLTEVAA